MTTKKIPITILTGFLGSGKTTLLNHILKGNHGLKIAVVENEFGQAGLDGALIKAESTEEIIEVSNGCLCCMVRKDWMDAIETLLNSGKEIDAIVIEASGASEPLPIAQSFLMNDMDGRVQLDSIICLIDALNYENLFAQDAKIALEQLEFADFIVMNKIDLVDQEKKNFLTTAIRRVNAFAPIIEAEHGKVNIDLLLGTGRFSLTDAMEEKNNTPHQHAHDDLETFEYTARGKFFVQKMDAFFQDLDNDCYRVKGFVQFVEKPDTWYLIQKAGARVTMEPWEGDAPGKSRLIFIGRNFKTPLITKLLDDCSDAPKSVLFM